MPHNAHEPSVGGLFESKVSAAEFARFKDDFIKFREEMKKFQDDVMENMVGMQDLRELRESVEGEVKNWKITHADGVALRLREAEKNVENLTRTVQKLEYLVNGESGVFISPSYSSDSSNSTSDDEESESDGEDERRNNYSRRNWTPESDDEETEQSRYYRRRQAEMEPDI